MIMTVEKFEGLTLLNIRAKSLFLDGRLDTKLCFRRILGFRISSKSESHNNGIIYGSSV